MVAYNLPWLSFQFFTIITSYFKIHI